MELGSEIVKRMGGETKWDFVCAKGVVRMGLDVTAPRTSVSRERERPSQTLATRRAGIRGAHRSHNRTTNMGKFKPLLMTSLVAIVAVEIWSRYLRSKVFPAA